MASIRDALEITLGDDQNEWADVIILERNTKKQRIGIHQRSGRRDDLERTVAQLRPAFHLNWKPRSVFDSMNQRIDAPIQKRKKYMQPPV